MQYARAFVRDFAKGVHSRQENERKNYLAVVRITSRFACNPASEPVSAVKRAIARFTIA